MKQKNRAWLGDDGELHYGSNQPTKRRFGCLKSIALIFVTVLVTLICEPFFEDYYLSVRCDSTETIDVISKVVVMREWPKRTSNIARLVESGKRYSILDTEYNRYMNDCWVKVNVDGTRGWVLTLLDKH